MGHQDREIQKELEKIIFTEDVPAAYPEILGLVFLRYICAAFEEHQIALRPDTKSPGGAPESGDSGRETENDGRFPGIFFIPARWDSIFPRDVPAPDTPALFRSIAGVIRAIERENPLLRGMFPESLKRFSGRSLPVSADENILYPAGQFLGDLSARETAGVFKYLLEKFEKSSEPDPLKDWRSSAAHKDRSRKTGSNLVPRCLAELAAHMLEPYQGRFYDPCCGSAPFLAGAADFVTSRQGKLPDLSFYAQECHAESWRIAGMNLIVRGIDTADILLNPDGPLQRDRCRDLRFDFITACPPLQENSYSWIQYVLDRLSPTGLGAVVLPKSSLVSSREGDRETRRALVDGRLVDCVVNLPPLIPGFPSPCLWFFSRAKAGRGRRADELLFIDARHLGRGQNRRHWEFSGEDIGRIARTYHNWRFPKASPYRDIRQFAVSVHMAQVREERYNLNPALYLGISETGEDTGRGTRFAALRAEFEDLLREESRLNRQLVENLRKIKFED
ncbi:MAG: type I restriction-modification system subunit M [Treponema sp.]|jgi:type I restriction enzyme M protein|nr:type I restriction-modification system subunit M [Treponema sp.]